MRPFLVTALEAGRLPRIALIALVGLYVLPGFVGRDPWRSADAIGFGVVHAMAAGGWRQWLLPEVAGAPFADGGPLAFWIAAAIARALQAASLGAIDFALGARVAAAAWLGCAFMLLRGATRRLASRPEAQPVDPFGAGASPVAYGHAVADAALLLGLATFGLVARVHETTADAAMLTVIAAFAYGLARGCDTPRSGGAIAGAAIAAAALVRTPSAAATLVLALVLAVTGVRALRLNARAFALPAIAVAAAVALPWPLALLASDLPDARIALARWLALPPAGDAGAQLAWAARTLPWFLWPAWPIAARTLWQARGRFNDAPAGIPTALLVALAAGLAAALLRGRGSEAMLIPLAVPMAMLAAIGLPTLARSVSRLIDWFAVATFSLFGIAVWAWWLAAASGWPPKMAAQSARFAAGFPGFPSFGSGAAGGGASVPGGLAPAFALAIAAGAIATLGWVALVRWRLARRPPMLWRPVVLSGAGMTLAWFLLMTLWMPVFDWRNSYRDVGRQLATRVHPDDAGACVHPRGLDLAQRASLAWFAALRFDDRARCEWLLVADRRGRAQPAPGADWTPVWEGRRPGDRSERFRLYRRAS